MFSLEDHSSAPLYVLDAGTESRDGYASLQLTPTITMNKG